MDVKKWSIGLFIVLMILFFMLAFFKNDVTTWIWQLVLPILVIIQVIVILKGPKESTKTFDEDMYDQK